jgi:hypothetical protein
MRKSIRGRTGTARRGGDNWMSRIKQELEGLEMGGYFGELKEWR